MGHIDRIFGLYAKNCLILDNHFVILSMNISMSARRACGRLSSIVLLSSFVWCMTSCKSGGEPAELHRLDRQISKGIMPEDSLSIKATETLFEISGYPYPSPLTLTDYAEKPSIHEHIDGVEREYADTRRESKALGDVFGRMSSVLPDVSVPHVFTIISPFTQSILVADTLLYIGLNHYLGADYVHYEYFPDYVRVLKERERIPIDVAEAIVRSAYPYHPSEEYPQVVTRLAYEGAVVEVVMRLTGKDEASVLGYNDGQYRWLRDNEGKLWQTIVGEQMLFSTDYTLMRSLVDVAPHVSVISSEVPGRAGRFIGHRLVKAYLDNNPSVLPESLLAPSFYSSPSLLTSAKYNP